MACSVQNEGRKKSCQMAGQSQSSMYSQSGRGSHYTSTFPNICSEKRLFYLLVLCFTFSPTTATTHSLLSLIGQTRCEILVANSKWQISCSSESETWKVKHVISNDFCSFCQYKCIFIEISPIRASFSIFLIPSLRTVSSIKLSCASGMCWSKLFFNLVLLCRVTYREWISDILKNSRFNGIFNVGFKFYKSLRFIHFFIFVFYRLVCLTSENAVAISQHCEAR